MYIFQWLIETHGATEDYLVQGNPIFLWGKMWGEIMTTRKAHPRNALTALTVRSITKPGLYADGNGLYLVVDATGAKRWMLRTMVQGRRRDMGLGGHLTVALAEARAKAAEYRATARNGGDPIAERRSKLAMAPTFREAAIKVHDSRKSAWKNEKHAQQWINTINQYAVPIIGERPVDKIGTPEVLRVLGAIWLTKPETAKRLKQRLSAVFDWAKAAGYLNGENPVLGVSKGLPTQRKRQAHLKAMKPVELIEFLNELHRTKEDNAAALALEFLILTATRTNEVLKARWSEIETREAVWTIPGPRMKAGVEHRVPLAERCIEILRIARAELPQSEYVFPGTKCDRPLSNMALLMKLRRMGRSETVHGFRSSFRDWTAEYTNFPNEVCEMALAHSIKDKAEAAYRRGDLFEKRRKVMAAWERFCLPKSAEIVQFTATN